MRDQAHVGRASMQKAASELCCYILLKIKLLNVACFELMERGSVRALSVWKDTYGKGKRYKIYGFIGHFQKRVVARLRKLKSKNRNLSGKGKLTDSFIDRLQNYYGIAVHGNVETFIRSSANVIAAFVSLLIKCRETDAWAVSHRKDI
ncbi:hypothetical protein TNCV_1697621 [Trichonephila clavipes]|nr:hypothetical protein TNCV_1697621 [Trichonephila clavipes]